MEIIINNVGKRYNFDWIFRKVDVTLSSQHSYVIIGGNGSGKSTLLQVVAGNLIPSEGTISYSLGNKKIAEEEIYQKASLATPYLELLEDLTLKEAIDLHAQFKPFIGNMDNAEVIQLTELEKAKNKQLKYFSSGMKQRVRLALAILSDTPLLLLDEPASNLDQKAILWYQNLVNNYKKDRLIIVCSNQLKYEYSFCDTQINIEDYK